jgi:serine/threonine protein kinase
MGAEQMSQPWKLAVDELAEWMQLSRNIVVPFVGAGVSRAANLPTWQGLAHAILETVHGFRLASDEELVAQKLRNPIEALSFARERLGDETFRRQIVSALTLPKEFVAPELARLCWRMNNQLVVTTNLDEVLELSAPTVDGIPAEPLTPTDSVRAALNDPGRRVLHLHGTLPRFETWVMTEGDYKRATKVTSPVGGLLQTLLLDRVVVFLGYSCYDPDLNLFLERVRTHFPKGSSNHYAVLPDLDTASRRRLLDYGIHPVEYTPSSNSHSEVIDFMVEVLTRFDPREAEIYADERSRRPSSTPLLPVSELRQLSFGARRDRLDEEFKQLFEQSSNYALSASSELPPVIKQRRSETIELLAGAWQVDTTPPINAIDGREVLKDIGRGGFGIVWLVEDVRSHERQALKVAHLQETSNYKFVERFKQGILAMRRLTNHGIKNTTRYIAHREVPLSVVMEYVDGGDLGVLIKNVPLELETRLSLAREIAEIVADAHEVPVYHRDLKPSNVLIRWEADGDPHAVLSDFDLAWFEGAINRTTTRIGDQAFASPEQLKEAHASNQARAESDVYAIGMLLVFLVTLKIPSAGQWYNRSLRKEVFESAERQFQWLRAAELFSDLVVRCAVEDPSNRPTARSVADELAQLHDAEKNGSAGLEFLADEVRSRIATTYAGILTSASGLHLEQRRVNGRTVIQASFSRQIRESDDRGRFKFAGDKAVKSLRAKLEQQNWTVQSLTSNTVDAKIVVTKELRAQTLAIASEIAGELSDAVSSWISWS